MATKLEKPLIRETNLVHNDKPVIVTLVPTKTGGNIIFKEKGGRGKGVEVPLSKVLADATGVVRTPVKAPAPTVPTGTAEDADLVDLGTLEARIMIDGTDKLTPDVKGHLWSIVREIREERREDLGLPVLVRGSARNKA